MRKWLKEIIREVIKEEIKQVPLIISNRPPTEQDNYNVGTHWQDKNEFYLATKINVTWEKIT